MYIVYIYVCVYLYTYIYTTHTNIHALQIGYFEIYYDNIMIYCI
jgi:hypothetical protein